MVQGSGIRVQGSEFRVQGSEFRVQGSGGTVGSEGDGADNALVRSHAQLFGTRPRIPYNHLLAHFGFICYAWCLKYHKLRYKLGGSKQRVWT
jgi:hypothetical protein